METKLILVIFYPPWRQSLLDEFREDVGEERPLVVAAELTLVLIGAAENVEFTECIMWCKKHNVNRDTG